MATISYEPSKSTASCVLAALSSTKRMASEVLIFGLPLFCLVGRLSRVSTAMDTPFSLMPSRLAKGPNIAATLLFRLSSGMLAPKLFSAEKEMDAYPSFGCVRTKSAEVSSLKS